MLNPDIEKAYSILQGETLERELIEKLSRLRGDEIPDLLSLANKVKNRFSKNTHICTIMNAKSGICGEDCRFCSQSSHHNTETEIFDLVDKNDILKKAEEAFATGVKSFGIVTSGTGYMEPNDEFGKITAAIDLIYLLFPDKNVCASLGNLSDETAEELAKHGVVHYNINIQTNPGRYGELISSTHSVNERIDTIKSLKKYGVKVCSGGILGLGETMEDRIELALTLRDLDVDVIPLNVLIPIEGTPLEGEEEIPVAEIARTFALFRLINPRKTIKFAAGRETRMKDFQGLLMLSGANGFLTGGYLTTRGRNVEDDFRFHEQLAGFGSG
jgi:biotin synthase